MELDIPRGTLCSHAEALSLLPSKAEHLLTVSSLTAALRASGKDFSVEPVYLGLTKGAENGDEIFVRDVWLKLDGETVIQARSACGRIAVYGQNYWIAERSLWASACLTVHCR